jgi:hypothetical protein
VVVACCLPVGFLNLWCHIAVEAVGGFHRCVVGDAKGVRFASMVKVVAVGSMVVRTEALASVPVGEGSRRCTGALQVLPSLLMCCLLASAR